MPQKKRSSNFVLRWKSRNAFYICLLFIVAISMFLGGFVYAAIFDKNTPTEAITEAIDIDTPIVVSAHTDENEPFYYDVPLSHDLQNHIRSLSADYSVPMDLVMAVIDTESSFCSSTISGTNDYGLMQINSVNHKELSDKFGVSDFLNPYDNLQCGIYILSKHLEATQGDIGMALMRYNNGPTGAYRLWQKGIYSTDYTEKVMRKYEFYKEESRSDADTSKAAKVINP